MINEPIILCGSGNSLLFDNKTGIDIQLKRVIENHYSIGLNNFFNYCSNTTFISWVDEHFYRHNREDLEKQPLLIGKYDPNLRNRILNNAFLIPPSDHYFGKNGLDKNRRMCWACKQEFLVGNDWLRNCPFCKSREIKVCGLWSRQLVGLFSLSLAIALGFEEIYCLGFDGCSINGKTHFYEDLINKNEIVQDTITKKDGTQIAKAERAKWFGVGMTQTPKKLVYNTGTYNDVYALNNKWFSVYKQTPEVKIYNVSPQSAINVFPKINYKIFFSMIQKYKTIDQNKARQKIRNYIYEKIK